MWRLKQRRTSPRLRGTVNGLALAVGVQTVLALGLTVPHVIAFQGAPEVRLQTAPIDPRDPLRGHYLTLNYAFNNAKLPQGVKRGQTVYLPLTKDAGNVWKGSKVQVQRPAGGLYLKGRVEWNYGEQGRVGYGIERFYLEESLARAEEERRWQAGQTQLIARVQVGKDGRARVVAVERDGRELR